MVMKKTGVGNPALTFTCPKFLFRLYLNSLHSLVSKSSSMPGIALEMLENWFRVREEVFKQTTLYLFRKEKAVSFLCAHQFPYRWKIISTLLTLPDRKLKTKEVSVQGEKRAKQNHSYGSPLGQRWFMSTWRISQIARIHPHPGGAPLPTTAPDTRLRVVLMG